MSAFSWFQQYCFVARFKKPAKQQARILKKIIRRLSKTQYGRSLNLNSSESYQTFTQKIPLVSYNQIKHWIERQRHKKDPLLVTGAITRYVYLDDSKAFPCTKYWQRSSEELKDLFLMKSTHSPYLLPRIQDTFFEFRDARQQIKRLHELEADSQYELIVSQSAGLYRYKTGLKLLSSTPLKNTPTFQVIL